MSAPVPLIRLTVHAAGALPLGAGRALGAALGDLAWRLGTPARRVTEVNVALCHPALGDEARAALVRRSLVETGRGALETAWIWTRPRARLERAIVELRGEALLREAERDGRGLIVATPHLGAWELCGLPLARERPLTCLYSPARRPALDAAIVRWRRNVGGDPLPLDARGLRLAIARLREGRTLGLLPDQEPPRGHGVFAPFLGIAANTMTLPGTLARRTGARVLVSFAERLPGGFRVHYEAVDEAIRDARPEIAAAAMNRALERCIARCPEQYLWSYPRFRLLPGRRRRVYADADDD